MTRFYLFIGVFIFIIIMSIIFCNSKSKISVIERINIPQNLIERISIPENLIPNVRVVISFTTIPSRMKYIPTAIDRLKKQTLTPDVVYVCVPHISKRKGIPYIIPEEWTFDKNVKIIRCEDYGPATKLLGCIPYEDDDNTIIITIDDDQIYDNNLFYNLVAYGMKFPNACLGTSALDKNLKTIKCPNDTNLQSPTVRFLEGCTAPLYRRKYITKEMVEFFSDMSPECFVSDDLTISAWLNMQNVPLIKICDEWVRPPKLDKIIDSHDALRLEDRNYVYATCNSQLEKLKILSYNS